MFRFISSKIILCYVLAKLIQNYKSVIIHMCLEVIDDKKITSKKEKNRCPRFLIVFRIEPDTDQKISFKFSKSGSNDPLFLIYTKCLCLHEVI